MRESEIKRIEDAAEELQRRAILLSQSEDIGGTSSTSEQVDLVTSLIDETKDYESLGRLVINLEKIITGASNDLKLEDGDSLFIPKKKQTITVIGEVFVPNSHIYDGDLDFSDYVNLSGGFTDFADESSMYVIRSDGRIVSSSQISSGFFRRQNNLEPGDTLVVPVKIDSFSQLKAATEITQIIYQMAIAAAAVNSF